MPRLKNIVSVFWTGRRRGQTDGFSILTVVLSLALLASITVGFTSVVQNRTARISNEIRAAKGELLAEAGVDIAVARLLHSLSLPIDSPRRIVADATPFLCGMEEDAALAISIQDAAGQVDLNAASPQLLSAFVGTVADAETASTVAEAIALRRANKPFRLVEELAFVSGVSAELYRALRPHITLYSGYTGLAKELVAEPLRARLAAIDTPSASFFGSQPTNRVFSVTVVARQTARAGFRLETILEVRPGRQRLYRALRWRGRILRKQPDGRDFGPGMDLSKLPDWWALSPCVTAAF